MLVLRKLALIICLPKHCSNILRTDVQCLLQKIGNSKIPDLSIPYCMQLQL